MVKFNVLMGKTFKCSWCLREDLSPVGAVCQNPEKVLLIEKVDWIHRMHASTQVLQ